MINKKNNKSSKFRLNCRTLILTYKDHIEAKNFDKFKGHHKVWHEVGETGYKHTHALFYSRKAYDTKNVNYFDIDEIHPNIKKILTKTHWLNCINYDKATKKQGSKFTTVKDTLTGNEYTWNGEARDAIQAHKRWRDVVNDSSLEEIVKKHLHWAKECFNCKPRFNMLGDINKLVLKDWQKDVLNQLENQNDRQIIWVYDKIGGKGKSWLTDYLLDNFDSIMFNSGRISDMAQAFDNEEMVIFDLPRSADIDFTPYRAMEMFKDGRIFSPKYGSCMKRFKKCKVIVFSNEMPDQDRLTSDRWNIIDLEKGGFPDVETKVPTVSLNINEKPKESKKSKDKYIRSKSGKKIKISKIKKRRNNLINNNNNNNINSKIKNNKYIKSGKIII